MLSIDESKKLSGYKVFPDKYIARLLEMYEVKKGDNILIWCDSGRRNRRVSPRLGKTLYTKLNKMGCNVSIVVGKEFRDPEYASNKWCKAVFSLGKGDFLISLPSALVPYIQKNGKRILTKKLINAQGFKVASASGLASVRPNKIKTFFNSFNHDPDDVKLLGGKISKAMEKTDKIWITCAYGSDLVMSIKGRRVIDSRGNWRAYSTNYPIGEVYTPPIETSANGVAYITSLRVLGDAYLMKKPVKVVFKDGVLIETSSKKLENALDKLEKFNKKKGFKNYKDGPRRIAEMGIGTNKKASLIGLMLNDEKVFGTCHIAIGSNKHFGGKTMINGHADQLIVKPTIYFDDKKIMEKGKLFL